MTSLKYDLERVGPYGFQDIAAALAIADFGPQVTRMGRGRDGGRDMECRGTLTWTGANGQSGEVWNGHTVFQVKHHDRLEDNRRNVAWFWQEIQEELRAWASTQSGRGDVPDYLVFITNVPLTPVPETGGLAVIDRQIASFLADLADDSAILPIEQAGDLAGAAVLRGQHAEQRRRMRRLRKWRIWDGNQIVGLLDAHDGVRRSSAGLLTPGDILASISQVSDTLPVDELGPALQEHARAALIRERNVYFNEAGGFGPGMPVERIVVDLPVLVRRSDDESLNARCIRYVLNRGDRLLRPSASAFTKPRHLVVAGAPGNGKTTISRFLVQAYRAAMLAEGATSLSDTHRGAIKGTRQALERLGRDLPRHRRWAMRVDLAAYADEHGTSQDATLVQWLASQVDARSDTKSLKRWMLRSWLRTWPSFIVLDGLDEVSEPTVRQRLVETIHEFVTTAEAEDWDVLVVATTRPMGYVDDLSAELFERIDLDGLTIPEALHYGELVTRMRLANDPDRAREVMTLLDSASHNESLKHLLRTPLQVAIMTTIAESAGQFAPDRYTLFWRYYETIDRREQSKTGGFSKLLRDHSSDILDLHERVGLELQMRAEAADGATAVLTQDELRAVAWSVLEDSGHKPGGAHARLLESLLNAATHRLVLLAPRGDEGYGFDVRSLQEMMAARRLTTGPFEQVLARLRLLAPSPHWRHTWVFAAGRCMADPQPHQRDAITQLVQTLDESAPQRLGRVVPVGEGLAWDLIDDGMAASKPRWRDQLLVRGLGALRRPLPQDPLGFARTLARAAAASDARSIISGALRDARGGVAVVRQTAEAIQELIAAISKELDLEPNVLSLASVRRDPTRSLPSEPADGWQDFDEVVTVYATDDTRQLLQQSAATIKTLASPGARATEVELEGLRSALADSSLAEVIEEALVQVVPSTPQLFVSLRDTVLPALHRQPCADALDALL